MEYRKNGENTYIDINENIIKNLAAGTYYVRVKGDSNHNPSAETSITIAVGRKLKIVVPAQQTGYTLTSTASEVDYLGTATLTFNIAEGYSKTANFAISLNGNSDANWINGQLSLSDVNTDVNIAVEGVADITAPTAEIKVKDNSWTSFLNNVTFGLFFKETQNVTITADDKGSGVNDIQYYVGEKALEYDELNSITNWQNYNDSFTLNPDNCYVVYAKVTDKAGNTLYISSDGLVFDSVAPAFYGIENGGVYYGDKVIKAFDEQHYPITFTVDGTDVTDKISDNDEYTITADNKEHTLVATDKAGNVTEYKITVYKNYTVIYKIDGEIVSTEIVGHGKDATAPAIPEKEGYTQTAPVWDNDGKNITADTEINAVYTINKYAVTYKADGKVVETIEVEHGKDVTAPAIPEKEGYNQTAPVWDNDGKSITADTEINAVYTINEYKITFMDENGVYKVLTYKHGETVEMPDVPEKDGYSVEWDTTIDKATDNVTIKAVYTKIPKENKPISPKTGDDSNLWLWIALAFISGATMLVTLILEKREEETEAE